MAQKRGNRSTRLENPIWRRIRELFLAVSVSAFLDRCMEEKYGKPKVEMA